MNLISLDRDLNIHDSGLCEIQIFNNKEIGAMRLEANLIR